MNKGEQGARREEGRGGGVVGGSGRASDALPAKELFSGKFLHSLDEDSSEEGSMSISPVKKVSRMGTSVLEMSTFNNPSFRSVSAFWIRTDLVWFRILLSKSFRIRIRILPEHGQMIH
jgi:hypothetical protein